MHSNLCSTSCVENRCLFYHFGDDLYFIFSKTPQLFYTNWKDIVVNINFKPGEGSGNMDKETVKKGSTFKLPPSNFKAPENKELKGWKIGETEYKVGDEITVNGNTTVTAIWQDIMVKITYDPNGGNWNNDSANQTIEVKKGTTITIMDAPVRNGYTFEYWKGSEYQPGASYTANSDHTFTAAWKPISKKPGTGNATGNTNKNGTAGPKTGDNNIIYLYAITLLLSASGITAISIRRKNR